MSAPTSSPPALCERRGPPGPARAAGTGRHRLWIAAGNEALAYTAVTGQGVRADRTWANLYDLRNHLAHSPAPRHRRSTRPPLHLVSHRPAQADRPRSPVPRLGAAT